MRNAVFLLLVLWGTGAWAELYTWKDAAGVSHYTNQADTVPQRYRKRMKTIPMPGDQKKEQSAGNPASSGQGISLPVPPPPPAASSPPPAAVSPPPAPAEEGAVRKRQSRRERRGEPRDE